MNNRILRYGLVVLVSLVILLIVNVPLEVGASMTVPEKIAPNSLANSLYSEKMANGTEVLTLSVILQSDSGYSFAEEIDFILDYPEITSLEEAEVFLSRYRANEDTIKAATEGLVAVGFDVVTTTDISMSVVAPRSVIYSILSDSTESNLERIENGGLITPDGLKEDFPARKFIECLMIIKHVPSVEENGFTEYTDMDNQVPLPHKKMIGSFNGERLHNVGLTGKGIRIGLIDEPLVPYSYYFLSNPKNISYFWFDRSTRAVKNTIYPMGTSPTHGTYVSTIIGAVAPDASIVSFFSLQDSIMLLEFNVQNNVVDVINMSFSVDEILPNIREYLAIFRTNVIQLMNLKKLMVVSGGNTRVCPPPPGFPPCSNRNGIAAIPELIAVGGLDFDYDYLENIANLYASAGANSFTSTIFEGRNVPDIAAIFGPIDSRFYKNYLTPLYGTSFSAPQVAGILGLLKEYVPDITQYRAKNLLINGALDITQGISGTGDPAGPGYDRATGFGLPMADSVIQRNYHLLEGWNLVGFPLDFPSGYNARDVLTRIRNAGGFCDNITMWDVSRGMYMAFVMDQNGNEYGTPFPISPFLGYFIRCSQVSKWVYDEFPLVQTPQALTFKPGVNVFAIPYSQKQCFAKHFVHESNGVCKMIAEYNGLYNKFDNYLGENFPIKPTKGYYAFCNDTFHWNLGCDPNLNEENALMPSTDDEIDDLLPVVQTTVDLQDLTISEPEGMGTNCAMLDEPISNVSGNTFSIRWITYNNCHGSVFVNLGDGIRKEFSDVRGVDYQGMHHLVKIEGLNPSTNYAVTIKSGDYYYPNFSFKTGINLPLPNLSYKVSGRLLYRDGTPAVDATCGARLTDGNWGYSMDIAFVPSKENGGFVINVGDFRDAMDQNAGGYFDLSTVSAMEIHCRTYSTYVDQFHVSLNPDNPSGDIGVKQISRARYPMSLFYPYEEVLDTTRPTFTMHAEKQGDENLYYLIQLSHNNFYTIDYSYNQYYDPTGWSRSLYEPNQVATFTMPVDLRPGVVYQWRASASPYPPRIEWGSVSRTGSFFILPSKLYLPVIAINE